MKNLYHAWNCLPYELLDVRGVFRGCFSTCWFCANPIPWASAPALREHQIPQEHREDISRQEMGCCPEAGQKKCPFAAHPAWGSDLPLSLCCFLLIWTEKAMLLDKNLPLIRPLGMLRIDSLLLLTECLQLETCSFQKIPQMRPQADASLGCKPH